MTENGRRKADGALILALAGGATVRDAARQAGLGETTVYRRLEGPAFRRQVSEVRAEMLDRAVGKLADVSTEAVRTLKELLDAESGAVRLGAARSILELGTKLRESTELAERISELEARAEAAAQAPSHSTRGALG